MHFMHIQPNCQVDSSNRVYVKRVGGSGFLPWLRVSSLLIRMLGGGPSPTPLAFQPTKVIPGANDNAAEVSEVLAPIPMLSEWGITLLGIALLGAGIYRLRRRC